MEVAQRNELFTLLTQFTLFTLFKLFTLFILFKLLYTFLREGSRYQIG